MMKIHLLDPRSDIFQSFITPDQLFNFAQRSSRNFNGRTLVVRNSDKARCIDLRKETPVEINALVMKTLNDLR